MNEFIRYQRGQVWKVGNCTIVIISADEYNLYEPNVIAVYLERTKITLPTHIKVLVDKEEMVAVCNKLESISKEQLEEAIYVGVLGKLSLGDIEVGVGEYLGIRLYTNGLRKPKTNNNKWDEKKFMELKTDIDSGMSINKVCLKYNISERSVMATLRRLENKYLKGDFENE